MIKKTTSMAEISIHALREEGDPADAVKYVGGIIFLSTPSARRATVVAGRLPRRVGISIHALREEGDLLVDLEALLLQISIHALREEGDAIRPLHPARLPYFYPRPPRGGRPLMPITPSKVTVFLSTPSARRATEGEQDPVPIHPISIHALREEGDRYRLYP